MLDHKSIMHKTRESRKSRAQKLENAFHTALKELEDDIKREASMGGTSVYIGLPVSDHCERMQATFEQKGFTCIRNSREHTLTIGW